MAYGTRKDSKSLPVEETLDKPFPFPLQERGNQPWPASSQQLPERVPKDPPKWVVYAHFVLDKVIQLIGNVSIATFFTYLFAAAMEILKIFSIQKDKTRERDEMKTKVQEIKCIKLKEMEHDKWKLEEQIKKACGNLFMISHIESMEWEMNLITMKELVFRCGAEIACLQKLVSRLESGARTTINWIIVQLTTGLVMIGMLCYWVYIREDVQTGTTVKGITAGCLLGVATHCIRKAQVLFDSYTLVSECKDVKKELEKPTMDCLMCKHAVEDALPEKKKDTACCGSEDP